MPHATFWGGCAPPAREAALVVPPHHTTTIIIIAVSGFWFLPAAPIVALRNERPERFARGARHLLHSRLDHVLRPYVRPAHGMLPVAQVKEDPIRPAVPRVRFHQESPLNGRAAATGVEERHVDLGRRIGNRRPGKGPRGDGICPAASIRRRCHQQLGPYRAAVSGVLPTLRLLLLLPPPLLLPRQVGMEDAQGTSRQPRLLPLDRLLLPLVRGGNHRGVQPPPRPLPPV